jgi:ADP-ribosylglycohydrolase
MATEQRPPQASRGLTELLGRALTDHEFRDQLFRDRNAATHGYQLTPADHAALENLDRGQLDQQAQKLSAGSASAMAISIVIRIKF